MLRPAGWRQRFCTRRRHALAFGCVPWASGRGGWAIRTCDTHARAYPTALRLGARYRLGFNTASDGVARCRPGRTLSSGAWLHGRCRSPGVLTRAAGLLVRRASPQNRAPGISLALLIPRTDAGGSILLPPPASVVVVIASAAVLRSPSRRRALRTLPLNLGSGFRKRGVTNHAKLTAKGQEKGP